MKLFSLVGISRNIVIDAKPDSKVLIIMGNVLVVKIPDNVFIYFNIDIHIPVKCFDCHYKNILESMLIFISSRIQSDFIVYFK